MSFVAGVVDVSMCFMGKKRKRIGGDGSRIWMNEKKLDRGKNDAESKEGWGNKQGDRKAGKQTSIVVRKVRESPGIGLKKDWICC